MMALLWNTIDLFPFTWRENFLGYLEIALMFCFIIFPAYVYYMAFAQVYKFYGFLIRIIMLYFMFLVEIIILSTAIMMIVSKGRFEGEILL